MTDVLHHAELLAPAPAVSTQIRIGYARVSTDGQHLERQLDALRVAGCRRVFAEKESGRDSDRPQLDACLAFLAAGDTLVVPALDRLSRSLQDLITTVGELRRREVGFTSLHEHLDTTTPGGRLVFHVFAALAEFIRELIVAGTREGLDTSERVGTAGVVALAVVIRCRSLTTVLVDQRFDPSSQGRYQSSTAPTRPRTFMRIGYRRVSTRDQNPDALHAAGCDELHIDKGSGKLARRPELHRARLRARAGDKLVITQLSRLQRDRP